MSKYQVYVADRVEHGEVIDRLVYETEDFFDAEEHAFKLRMTEQKRQYELQLKVSPPVTAIFRDFLLRHAIEDASQYAVVYSCDTGKYIAG